MDDTLHALNYLNALANLWFQSAARLGGLSPPSTDYRGCENFGPGGLGWSTARGYAKDRTQPPRARKAWGRTVDVDEWSLGRADLSPTETAADNAMTTGGAWASLEWWTVRPF